MKTYKIKAKSLHGKLVEEIISAESEADVNRIAAERNLFITSIRLVTEKEAMKKKLGTKELITYCQLMSAMLNAGTAIDKALNLARLKAETPKVREIYGEVYEEVQKGLPIHEAMKATGTFPQLLVNMVSSGAITGNLGDVFKTMADYYEKDAELNRKIKGAMTYPIILGVMSVAAIVILTVFVLPGIMESFTGAEMPFLTRMLMGFSDFLITKWWLIVGVAVGGSIGFKRALAIRSIKIKFDKFRLNMPIVGPLLRTIYSARAARTISSLYSNGAKMITIVQETGGTIGNTYVEELFDEIYIKVSTGERLSSAMEDTGVFDPMLYSMIEVGEETGDLEETLTSTATYFNNEADGATERLVSLLEPVFLIFMGITIGTIVVAIMQPLLSMYSTV